MKFFLVICVEWLEVCCFICVVMFCINIFDDVVVLEDWMLLVLVECKIDVRLLELVGNIEFVVEVYCVEDEMGVLMGFFIYVSYDLLSCFLIGCYGVFYVVNLLEVVFM